LQPAARRRGAGLLRAHRRVHQRIHEIHGNGAYRLEMKKFNRLVEQLRRIRVVWSPVPVCRQIHQQLFHQSRPLLVFILGGYLTIRVSWNWGAGGLPVGQEKLYDP